MSRIYIYKGNLDSSLFIGVKAMLVFGNTPVGISISNTKHFAIDEARKGLEQLKRWVSTGAFKTVVLSNFLSAMENGNTAHILEWLEDHSSEPDFPTLVLVNDKESDVLSSLSRIVDSEEELGKIINT